MERNKVVVDILEEDNLIEQNTEIEDTETNTEINRLMSEIQDIKDKYIRVCADYTNLKKRTLQEKKDVEEYTVASVLKSLLPIIDGLNSVSFENATIESLIEGFQMIKTQIDDVFRNLDVEEIDGLGEEYNSKIHEALNTIETEEVESGKITKVYLKGYKYKDKVIRQSMVEVAKQSLS
jgi:molecular chaperone GrpE